MLYCVNVVLGILLEVTMSIKIGH